MSTLKADIVEASTTDGNVTIRGNGSGTVAISDNTSITGTFIASGFTAISNSSLFFVNGLPSDFPIIMKLQFQILSLEKNCDA